MTRIKNRPDAAEARQVESLRKRFERERKARQEAEAIAEKGMLELYQKQREVQLLQVVADAANRADAFHDVLQFALDRVCAFTGWPVGHVYLPAGDGTDDLISSTLWHLDQPERFAAFRRITEACRMPPGVGLPGRVLSSGKPAWIMDVTSDSNFPRARPATDIGVKAAFGFPVLAGTTVAAVLEFFSPETLPPDARLLEVMALTGAQLGRVAERNRAQEAILRSKGQFQKLIENASDIITILNADGTIRLESPAVVRILGYTAEEMVGKNTFEFLHPDDIPHVEAAFQKALKTPGLIPELSFRHRHKDGSWRVLEGVGNNLLSDPIVAGIVFNSRDVTERRKAEEELRGSEQRYRQLFERNLAGVFRSTLDGRVLDCNDACARIFGLSSREEAFRYRTPELYLNLADRGQVIERLQRDRALTSTELCLRRKDGGVIWVLANATLLEGEDGSPPVLEGTIIDITARKWFEEALRASEERYRELFENANDIVYTQDMEGRFQSFNKAGERITGYLEDEACELNISQIVAPEYHDLLRRMLQAKVAGNQRTRYELEILAKDGRRVPLEISSWLVYRDGQPVGIQGIARDMTERKEAEDQIRRLNTELEQRVIHRTAQLEAANRELHVAKEDAERANRAKSEFLSRMSHELRTPLNSILGFGQLLEITALQGEDRDSVNQILRAGRHLLDLINEVLDLARIESGHLVLSPEPVSISDVLREVLDLVRPMAAQRHIRFAITFWENSRMFLLADRQRLKQVLLNLLSNAVKYNSQGGSVTVACEAAAEKRVRISVTDTGPGMSAEDTLKLFSPFERLAAEQTTTEGTGLGLAVSKRLVEVMGGRIGVESQAGLGSTFWVELPWVEGPVERLERTTPEMPELSVPDGKTRTLLYIEDNAANLKLIQRILSQRPEIRILSADQGLLGLELAREHRPDLILLDLHLPDIAGDDALRQLRADSSTRTIPVVVISADATPGRIKKLLELGADAYLTKPLDIKEFVQVIEGRLTTTHS